MLGFSEHEMLELMLFYAIPRADTNELAHELLNRFGSISEILSAERHELAEVKGLGESAASLIKLIDNITRSVGNSTIEQITADPIELLKSDLIKRCGSVTEDSFTIYYINSRSSVTDTCNYSINDLLSGRLKLRKVIEDAVILDAPSVIIGICHKNKTPVPTKNDYQLIKKLTELMKTINVTIDDALIAGKNVCFSLRTEGAFSF
jgi:DNA repair protein RadC